MRLRNPDRVRTPLRYMLPAAVMGFLVGLVVAIWLDWDPFFTGVGFLLLAQVVVEWRWAER
jgi:hypothetical protein